jgi:hypothetical protein
VIFVWQVANLRSRTLRGLKSQNDDYEMSVDFLALAGGLRVKVGTTALEVQSTYKLATGKITQVAIDTHPISRSTQCGLWYLRAPRLA